MTIDEILQNFAFLDDWEDRYRYVIDLGAAGSPIWGAVGAGVLLLHQFELARLPGLVEP